MESLHTAAGRLDRLIAASGADAAVAWEPLDRSSPPLLIRARVRFHAASTIKLAIMIELFRRAADQDVRLDDPVAIENRFYSIVDGEPYALSAADDSDSGVYHAIGASMTMRELCEAMITRSSNLAANILLGRLGVHNIQATMDRLGANGMRVLRGLEDQKAFDAHLNNTTNALALQALLSTLGRGEIVSHDASAEMIAMLSRQTMNDAIPAGLPPGTRIAHKTGTITGIHHDAAIVYGDRPYALVVLVRGIEDQHTSAKLIADIARIVNGIN